MLILVFGEGWQSGSKLDQYGIYTEVHTIPNTPHPFWLFHPWFNETVEYMMNFLDKILKK